MEYKIISTGSKGNAVVVDGRILIDCGVPFRRLESVYRDLDAVLLTHIHSDHFQPKTLARLAAERPSLRFFACPWLGPDLQNAGVPLRQITITTPDRWYDTGYCFVKACETKHNARNCCWHIWFNDGSKVFYATDMGNLNGITAPYYPYTRLITTHEKDGSRYCSYILYKRTSAMNSSEMSHLIDGARQEAHELGIDI